MITDTFEGHGSIYLHTVMKLFKPFEAIIATVADPMHLIKEWDLVYRQVDPKIRRCILTHPEAKKDEKKS